MFDTLVKEFDQAITELQDLEDKFPDSKKDLFSVRRNLTAARDMLLKQGIRVPLAKTAFHPCLVCDGKFRGTTETMYLHLRKIHEYSDTAASEAIAGLNNRRTGEIQALRELLPKYTEAMLEDDFTD